MKMKKFLSSITATLCFASTFAVMPQIAGMQVVATEAVRNDFEITYEGWHGSDIDSSVEVIDGIGFDGSRGMSVTERTSENAGAVSSKGFYLWGGIDYKYSVKVKADTDEVFHVSLLYKDEETEEATTVELATKSVKAGEWAEIAASYKAPENTYEYEITITTESTNDFVFDDVLITSKEGKAIEAKAAAGGLKDAFKGYGFRVGNILNGGTIRNSAITASFLKDYDAVECENETKADAVLRANGSTDTNINVSLDNCAAIADFAVKNNLAFRGHAFVWHSQTPAWFLKEGFNGNGNWVSPATMDKRLESYIKNVFNAFATQYPTLNLYAYDVCNECISDDSNRTKNNGGAREPGDNNVQGGKSAYVAVYGDNSFVEKAFTYARKYAPAGCKLFYNDYNEYWDHKRDCIINTILKPLKAKGLIDGMGMQSHIDAGYNTFSGTVNYLKAMDMYLDLGLEVHVSELDISLDNGQTLNDQADKYEAIFKHAMEVNTQGTHPGKVTLLQVWGPNDANTWISGDKSPTLYDKNNQPKAAYNKLMALGDGNGTVGDIGSTTDPEPNEYGWWYQCGFEDGVQSWTDRGGNKVAQSSAEHYTEWGNNSLLVSDRTSAWMGAAYSLSPRIFKAGEEYSFSAHVKQNSESAVKFMMKIEYTDASGETAYDEVASVTAPKGKWAQLANTNYKIPADASNVKIYIETEESLTDFYVDEAIGAVGGTKIAGEGQPAVDTPSTTKPTSGNNTPTGAIAGDVNNDKKVDVFDMILMRQYAAGNFANAPENADVNNDGEVNVADLVTLQKYLLGEIKELKTKPAEKPVSKGMRTMSEYTPVVQAQVSEFETADSKQEKAGVQYGTIKSATYYSTTCKRNKPYNILLPANYDESKKYPVLYVMHGYWENQDRMIIEGNGTMYTRQIIGNAIASGEAEDMIVVFPYIYSSDTQDACSGMDDFNNNAYDNFINDLTKDLMPHIESTYSVKTGRENTAITGFSMGGRESLLIGMKRPDLFGYVGAICPAPGVTGSFKWNSEAEAPSLLFITAGSNDTVVYDNPKTYHENFTKNNVPHIWHYVNGGYHGDNSIHAHLYNFVRAVFKA